MSRLLVAGAAAALLVACGPLDTPLKSDVDRELERGASYVERVTRRGGPEPSLQEAIAAGYAERLRLGLGSPFRLVEYSLQDPRLPKAEREKLAWGLLRRTLEEQSYRIDPAVLERGSGEDGARHLSLVTGAIRGPADPDAGVLAVRLAYMMAEAEGSVPPSLNRRVSRVAALVRDRLVSRADAERLLRAAGGRTDPLALLTVWRVNGEFRVEQPTVLSPSSAVQREAIALAPRILESIRSIREGSSEPVPAAAGGTQPLLGEAAARLLSEFAERENTPHQTPVVIAVHSYRRGAPEGDSVRGRFFVHAVNEERLAAEAARVRHEVGDPGAAIRYATVAAAVGLRAYAQERPWFPGFGGPARLDLEDRFGLESVEFPDDVPAHWRPYYRRLLASALSDLRRVVPSLDLRGLNIRFESREGSPGTLAVHDPRSRTIYLPPATGAGTVAHEIAHDVDWQTALRRYGVRGDYGTDRAVRLADGQLAAALRGLTTASLTDLPPTRHTHATRPAEVFARHLDWFVAVTLAREGRLNGYLSSIQDDVLTGYGTVTPPDPTGGAGEALVTVLDEVAPVYAETRRWFLGRYGRFRVATAYDLGRTLVRAPLEPWDRGAADADAVPEDVPDELILDVDGAPSDSLGATADSAAVPLALDLTRLSQTLRRLDQLEGLRDEVLERVDGSCRAVAYDDGAMADRRRMVLRVAEARARGEALTAAGALVGAEGREWLEARLEGRSRDPAPPEPVRTVLVQLADRVKEVGLGPTRAATGLEGVLGAGCGPVPAVAQTPATSGPQTSLWSWSW